jgi:hypothetical protein
MDVSDASYYIYIEKKKNKGSQMGHTKKIFKKKKTIIYYGVAIIMPKINHMNSVDQELSHCLKHTQIAQFL